MQFLLLQISVQNRWYQLPICAKMVADNRAINWNLRRRAHMTKELFFQAIWKFALGVIAIGILLFVPAGTVSYWNAWLLMGILFVPMFFAGMIMMRKNPELLKKRLHAKERQIEQALVIKLSGLMFVIGFVIAGLGFRLQWMMLPDWISWAAAVLFLFSYLLYAEVLRENTYLSRTIEVQQGQKVIDTGLYGIVRHPMYSATIVLFLSMPLVLGSMVSFVVFLAHPIIIAKRIRNEEIVLEKGLEGYAEYKKKVKYKIIPFVW
ncbi:MAG: isoprenylcysteine carboxylmethyltransferase family protein [Eubacteriales bacterium]|nr:isoprenylcysteine carboxylmethyltransferase family protein [Eubacteriales bacterium]